MCFVAIVTKILHNLHILGIEIILGVLILEHCLLIDVVETIDVFINYIDNGVNIASIVHVQVVVNNYQHVTRLVPLSKKRQNVTKN